MSSFTDKLLSGKKVGMWIRAKSYAALYVSNTVYVFEKKIVMRMGEWSKRKHFAIGEPLEI